MARTKLECPPRLYYILDTRSCVGNCGLWWGPARSGYVCSIDEAGKYEENEALAIQRGRGTDVAIPCFDVDALAVRHVRVDTDAFYALKNKAKRRRPKRPYIPASVARTCGPKEVP